MHGETMKFVNVAVGFRSKYKLMHYLTNSAS